MITEGGIIRIEDSYNTVDIKNNVMISNAFFSVADTKTSIQIGENSLISSNVIFRTSDSHSILSQITNKRINPGKDISIGKHCWIGYGVTILKGTVIEDNSIIGTHSVVSGTKVPNNCCAVGIPAKVIKTNVYWVKERIRNDEI